MQKNPIRLGIGFATGRKSFRKVLNAYIYGWNETRAKIPQAQNVRLTLFVAYDLNYSNTQSTDFTNLSQETVDAFDDIVFMGAKNTLKSLNRLTQGGALKESGLRAVFGAGYAGKRNAILYAALENHMDYLLYLDDDEYPMAVTNNNDACLWSGQSVLAAHLAAIGQADVTNGYHCGYISPIPHISFSPELTETDFQAFINAISNDIINWDSIRGLMATGGVTYADTDVLIHRKTEVVEELGGCKFISGSNLCLNLTQPERTFPFFNPPGARGEDTFLSTLLSQRQVLRVPCYTFHDGFSAYRHLLDGVLPITLTSMSDGSNAIVSRFLAASTGWVRYKPLLTLLTRPRQYEQTMRETRQTLSQTLPKLASYFNEDGFLAILPELEHYARNVRAHQTQFLRAQDVWRELIRAMA